MANPPEIIHDWKSSVNNLVSNSNDETMRRDLLFALVKKFKNPSGWLDLSGAADTIDTPWETYYSATASDAGTPGDGIDRWGSESDLSWQTTSNDRSWHVLVHPHFFGTSDPLYMLIDCSVSSTANRNGSLGVYLSRAGFTGGATNSRPTATDELMISPQGGTTATGAWQGNSTSGATSRRWHFQMTKDGRRCRIWITHDGACVAFWDLFPVENHPPSWTHPVLMCIMSGTATSEQNIWFNNWRNTSNKAYYRGYDNVFGAFQVNAGMVYYGGATPSAADTPIVKSIDGWDNGLAPTPIQLAVDKDASAGGILDYIPDCWWGSGSLTTGNAGQDEHGNDYAFVSFGDMITVWPQVAPVV